MRQAAAAFCALGALVLLVGGCGGGSSNPPLTKADYVKQMSSIGKSLSKSINSVATVTSPKDAATALTKVQGDLRDAAAQMKKISPPADIKDEHEKLTHAVSDFADQLGTIVAKLKSGNLSALGDVSSLEAFHELQTAANAITKAGYKIGGSAG